MNRIAEPDWKQLRTLKDSTLRAACESILEQVRQIVTHPSDAHAAYLDLWQLQTQTAIAFLTRNDDEEI